MYGFEREAIRVTAEGLFSFGSHPPSLGSSLTHAFITTDFSESQLELVTPPDEGLHASLRWLNQIHLYVSEGLGDELAWPFSMPPKLPEREGDIPLATFGPSPTGKEKTTYRSGIGLRYGRRRLTISGAHANFSFNETPLVRELLDAQASADGEVSFDPWLHIVRNLYRRLPYFTYLFGASPAFDKSFRPAGASRFREHLKSTYYAPYATSLRMSDIGYTSAVQDAFPISYDSLEAHLRDLALATSTCHPEYLAFCDRKRGQLNPKVLQIENELYRPFRLQQQREPSESLVKALRERGVNRIEMRLLDIDPESPCGVDPKAAGFLYLAMVDCLTQPSPPISASEWQEIGRRQEAAVWHGRDPKLKIPIDGNLASFHEMGKAYCEDLAALADRLDADLGTDFYQGSLNCQIEKWAHPGTTPSGRHLAELLDGNSEFVEHGFVRAREHGDFFRACDRDARIRPSIVCETERSKTEYHKLSDIAPADS